MNDTGPTGKSGFPDEAPGGLLKRISEDPHIGKIVETLRDYEPERIILFGSHARSEADAFSDYDIVVIKKTDRPFLERMRDMVRYLVQFSKPVEILVYTPEEFDSMGEVGIGWIVKQEGVTLYERPGD